MGTSGSRSQGPRGLTWAGSHGLGPCEGGLAGAGGQTCSVPGCQELEEARPLGKQGERRPRDLPAQLRSRRRRKRRSLEGSPQVGGLGREEHSPSAW